MKKIYTILLFLTIALLFIKFGTLHASGGNISLEIAQGGGYGNAGFFNVIDASLSTKTQGSWSTTSHIGLNIFFSKYVGLGVGADLTRYGTTLILNGSKTYSGVTDTEGELYDHHLSITNWKENDQALYIEVPLSVKFSIPTGPVFIIGEVGAKWGNIIYQSYNGKGEITHTGKYDLYNMTIENQSPNGFYTEKNFTPGNKMWTKGMSHTISVFGKFGLAIPLTEKIHLTTQFYGQYNIVNLQKVTSVLNTDNIFAGTYNLELGFANDRPDMRTAHYFMPEYQSVTGQDIYQGITPRKGAHFATGLEIGIRFFLHQSDNANKSKYSSKYNDDCHCVRENQRKK